MFVVFQQLLPGDVEYDEKKSNKFPKTPYAYRDRVYLQPRMFSSFYDNIEDAIKELKREYEWFEKQYKLISAEDSICHIDTEDLLKSYVICHNKTAKTMDRVVNMGIASVVYPGETIHEHNEKCFIQQFKDDETLLDIQQNIIDRITDLCNQKGKTITRSRGDSAACNSNIPVFDFEHFPVEIELGDGAPITRDRIYIYYLDKEFKTPCVKMVLNRRQIPLISTEVAGITRNWNDVYATKRRHYLASKANIDKLVEVLEKKL